VAEKKKPAEEQAAKPKIPEQAGTIIFELLKAHPDGLSRSEIIELKGKEIPGNKRGHYIAEGVARIRGQGHELTREGRKYVLKS
jgi:hypothetical protein